MLTQGLRNPHIMIDDILISKGKTLGIAHFEFFPFFFCKKGVSRLLHNIQIFLFNSKHIRRTK